MAASISSNAPSKKRVLLVEDEEVIRQHLREFIESDRIEVVECANGLEAMDLIRNGNFDLVVSDVSLPGIGGDELVKRLVNEGSKVPVALMSGQLHHTKKTAKAMGAIEYFEKPMEILGIPDFIEQFFAQGNK